MCFPYWTTGKYINILFNERMMLVNRSIFKSIRCFNLILAWSTVITLSDPWSSSSWLLESEDDGFAVLAFWILRHLLNKIYCAKFHCDCAKFHLNCANFHWRFHGFYQTTILPTFIEIVPFLIINVPLYNLFLCLKCQLGPPSVTKNHHFQSVGIPREWQKIITSSLLGSPVSDEKSSLPVCWDPPSVTKNHHFWPVGIPVSDKKSSLPVSWDPPSVTKNHHFQSTVENLMWEVKTLFILGPSNMIAKGKLYWMQCWLAKSSHNQPSKFEEKSDILKGEKIPSWQIPLYDIYIYLKNVFKTAKQNPKWKMQKAATSKIENAKCLHCQVAGNCRTG